MTAASAVGHGWTWSIGSALETAASVLLRHFVPFVITALIAGLPNVVYWFLIGRGASLSLLTISGLVSMVINTIGMIFVIQTLVYGTVQALRGRTVPIGDCLLQGVRRLPVGIAVGFLAYIGIVIGTALLVVPGAILFIMWSVALPANTVERTGILASLARSGELTRGRRWRVFGTIIVPLLISLVTSWILIGIFGYGLRGMASPAFQIVSWVVHAIEQAFTVCVFATLYYYLRRDKEGVEIEQIAAVFD
jgi:hypothetical protein